MIEALDSVVEVSSFSKVYGEFQAVNDLSFDVKPGEIVGIVGTNGAGKTTTLRSIVGLLRPTEGILRVGGFEVQQNPIEAKKVLAYIPDNTQPFSHLTVTEHLHFTALAYKVPNAESKYATLLAELELASKRDAVAATLSRGMLQKLSLACAFLREPKVIILDEPLTGLDPRGIRNIKDSIRKRAESGIAFLLSSHLLMLVEELCHRVLIMHRGRKVAFGTIEEVRAMTNLHENADLEDVFLAMTEHSLDAANSPV